MSNIIAYIVLILAVVLGTAANGFAKGANGFTLLLPSLLTAITIVGCMFTLSIVMKTIPVGITYASFAGLCIIATTLIGIYKFNDPFDINYWVEVWINYYNYVINNLQKKRVALICYEDLAENSIEYLKSKINENEFLENVNFSEFKNMNKFVNAKVNDKIKEEAYIIYSKLILNSFHSLFY